jgi:hypothetical protein
MAKSTDKKTVAKRAEALSEEVLESLRDRQQSVIEAMRKFVDRLDDAIPSLVDPAVRKKVVAAIGDYYEQLATTTNEVVGRMLRSAIGTAQESTAKKAATRGTTKKAATRGTTKKAATRGTTKKAATRGTTKKAATRPRRRQQSS